MSWTDEEIDNLFKGAANAQSFEYNDAYFSEIEAALPVNKKGGKDFLWMGTALLFIAVLTTGYFVSNTGDASFDNGSDQLAKAELNNNEQSNQTKAASTTNTNANQSALVDNAQIEITSENVSNDVVASNLLGSNAKNIANHNRSEQQIIGWENSMYNLATRNVGVKNSNASNQSIALSVPNAQAETLGSEADEALLNELKENYPEQFAPVVASLDVNSVSALDQELNRHVTASLNMPPLGELRPKAGLYAEFNVGMSQSLITPSEVASKSVGGGIGVETYLGNFNLTTGVNFKASFHDDLFLTRTGKVYGFGSKEGQNEYDVQRIYSFELPIALGYNVGRHNINLGVRPSFVVGGQMRMKAFEDGQLIRQSMINGLPEGGLKLFGLKPTFGYAYRMNNWTIGANIGIQLMEAVNEEYINGFNNQFPIDGQIYLRRTIRIRR